MDLSFFEITKRMNRLNVLHRISIHRQAAKNELYFGQMPILEYVESHDHCTQCEVAGFMKVSPPSIATSIKRMQKNGLLEKETDESDLRCNHITITEKGKDLSHKCRGGFDRINAQLFSGFTTQECEQLCGYFDRMIDNLSTGEFSGKSYFSLVAEEKKLINQQIVEELDSD